MTRAAIRVVIADDHATVRHGVRLLIDSQPDMAVVGEASEGGAVLELIRGLSPDVVVLDLAMPGVNGLQATRQLKDTRPELPVIALTRHDDESYLQELLRAGVSGYVLKQSASVELLQAIRAAAKGGQYLDSAITGRVSNRFAGRAKPSREITEREAEVLRLIAWGHSNKEIAAHLNLSVKTVEVHKANAMRKLELGGRIDIVRYALLKGWLQES